MKTSKALMTLAMGGMLCVLTACSSGTSFVKPGYDFNTVGKVAVLVTMNVGNPAQQQEIADLFAMQVLQKGYDVIDRANLADLNREAEFQTASGIASDEGRKKLAIHNVSAVIVLNVSAPYAYQVPGRTVSYWVRGRSYWDPNYGGYVYQPGHYEYRQTSGYMAESGEDISMTAKMLDVQSGTLLWAGEGTGSLKSGLTTVGGTLLGAGAGVVGGALIGRTTGAIIGGVAGGLAGNVAGQALEQNLAQLMRSVIEKTCKGLPVRAGGPVALAPVSAPVAADAGAPLAAPVPAAVPGGWDTPWPRSSTEGSGSLTMYQPKIQKWTDNVITCQAAVSSQSTAAEPVYGVATLTAGAELDKTARTVTLKDFRITALAYADSAVTDAAIGQRFSQLLPVGARTVPLAELGTRFALSESVKTQIAPGAPHGENAGPRILFTTTPTLLVLVDGEPVLKPLADVNAERVVNTRALIVKTGGRFYLTALNFWYEAGAIEGPWVVIDNPPALLARARDAAVATRMVDLMPPEPGAAAPRNPPAVRVSTVPLELIQTDGPPQLLPVEGDKLLQVKNTDDVIFLDLKTNQYYVLLANHWYASKSLYGPWVALAAANLPAEIAKIPAQVLTAPPASATATQPTPQPAQPAAPAVAAPPYEPPPPPVVVVPPTPGPDYYWTDGYWDWGPTGYIWFGGRWSLGIGPGRIFFGPGHFGHGFGHGRGHWR